MKLFFSETEEISAWGGKHHRVEISMTWPGTTTRSYATSKICIYNSLTILSNLTWSNCLKLQYFAHLSIRT